VAEGQEAELGKVYAKSMKVLAEVRGAVPREKLNGLKGVQRFIEVVGTAQDTRILKFECDGDLRAQISALLVKEGVELLEIGREGDGLEAVFMNLVKASKTNH
jgi:hypothetical protein